MKTVDEAFEELRASLENNMKHILRADPTNESQAGHYPAAILIVVGSEVLSKLQGKAEEDHVFVEMMAEHDVEAILARKLFDALRNGLAHLWDTNLLDVGAQENVELVISWEKERHLSFRSSPSPSLYLNVRAMWSDLQKALARCAAVLERDRSMAGSLAPSRTTFLNKSRVTLDAWQRFLAKAPKAQAL